MAPSATEALPVAARGPNAISRSSVVDDAIATVEVDTGTVGADTANVRWRRLNLEFTEIRSPVDGKTGPILVQPGNVIFVNAAAPPLVTIAQIKPIKVSFACRSPTCRASRRGPRKASWSPRSLCRTDGAKKLTAPVNFVSNAVSNTGTIELRSDFANEDEALVPGQLVDVTVELDDIPGAIVVPRVAVINGPDGTYVYRVNHGAVRAGAGVRSRSTTARTWRSRANLRRRQCGDRRRSARAARRQGHRPAPDSAGRPAARGAPRGAKGARAMGPKPHEYVPRLHRTADHDHPGDGGAW